MSNGDIKYLEKSEKNPWDIHYLDAGLNNLLLKHFRGERSGFVQVGPKKYFLPDKFAAEGHWYHKFKPRATDTWVVSFPRSGNKMSNLFGTTWTQEMVWLLGNDLDYPKGLKVPLVERFPFLEFSTCVNDTVLKEFLDSTNDENTKNQLRRACNSVLEDLENMNEPRFIKSHLPFSLLSPDLLNCGAKVIYVARNPKDVAVSYYNFHQFIKTLDFVGDFKTFWNFFQQDLELWTPYWEHIKEAWNLRNNPNLLFLFYGDLKKDLKGNVEKVAKFLHKEYNEKQIEKLCDHLKFENFQKNQSVNMEVLRDLGMLHENNQRCIRKGKSGGWKEMFTPELNDAANDWIKKNLADTDLSFPEAF